MIAVKNKRQLIDNGETSLNRRARKLAIENLEAALNASDPKCMLESKLLLNNSTLKIDGHVFNLERLKNVYVIGGGKAGGPMAEAVEQILGKRVTEGIVNVPRGTKNKTSKIELHWASHPVPDEAGVEGAQCMLDILECAKANDLVICLISGGGSSLMPLPRKPVSLIDKREMTQALLKSGATINEVNTVRKHISDFKGGWLAKRAYPANVLNLILSDVVGDPLDFIASGPTVPDSTTFKDAIEVLKKYNLWAKAPESIRKILSDGDKGLIPETPKADDIVFRKVHNIVVGNNRSASLAAREHLKSKGLKTLLLTATLEGEARDAGVMLATIAREVSASGNPVPKPAGIVAGGETTVTVKGKGLGGRNQELVLAAASKLKGSEGTIVASLSTDGIDGPTDAAGAIADGKTATRAIKMGLTPEKFLAENNSYRFFSRLSDLIFTGPTGTNVNDVSVMVIL
jgi:glycerate-2-kinase